MESLTVDWALERLKQGSERFVNDRVEAANRDRARRHELAEDQNPFAVVFSCADS